jgi:hypothetical protein
MHVLIAFDKFKDCLTAPEACRLTAAALRERQPAWTTTACPLADGGEGFAEILTDAAGGEHVAATVTGPRGAPVSARYGLVAVARVRVGARQGALPHCRQVCAALLQAAHGALKVLHARIHLQGLAHGLQAGAEGGRGPTRQLQLRQGVTVQPD